MKRAFFSKFAFAAAVCLIPFWNTAGAAESTDRKEVDRLWKEYEKTVENDLPERSLTVLGKIRDKARSKRLSHDFYRAGKEYVRITASRDWKQREQANDRFRDDLISYGEPVLLYIEGIGLETGGTDECMEFLGKWEKKLRKSVNRDVWENFQLPFMWPVLSRHIGSDWEYVLLSMAFNRAWSEGSDSLSALLEKEYPETYPVVALYELYRLNPAGPEGYAAYIGKYSGKAAAVLAECMAMNLKFRELERNGADGKEYLRLREECREFIARKKGFSGEEKMILEDDRTPENIIGRLEEKNFTAEVHASEIEARLRNLKTLQVSLYRGEDLDEKKIAKEKTAAAFTHEFVNGRNSFYALDTVKAELPQMPDGEYLAVFESGKLRQSCRITRRSIALAAHRSADGWLLYAADRKSGKPVEEAELTVGTWDGRTLLKKNVRFNGATLMDREVQEALKGVHGRCHVQCRLTDGEGMERSSEKFSLYSGGNFSEGSEVQFQAQLLTDRSACRPGETLQFKAVVYKDFRNGKMNTAPQGTKVRATLVDAERNEVCAVELQTGEYGSVAGKFDIPSGHRNGEWRLCIASGDGSILNARWFTVDEFKLPEFTVSFADDGVKHFPGEEVEVKGRLSSYAGNSLSDAKVAYTVSGWGGFVRNGSVEIEQDGSFTVPFRTEYGSDNRFTVTVKVTDGAGQTLEFSRWVNVDRDFNLRATLENGAEGEFTGVEDRDGGRPAWRYGNRTADCSGIVGGQQAEITAVIEDSGWKPLTGEIGWKLIKGGEVLRSGKCSSGEKFSIDFAGLGSGLYKVEFSKSYACMTAGGKTDTEERTCTLGLLKIEDSDTALRDKIENVFKVIGEDGKVAFLAGASDGEVWANVIIYDMDSHVLVNERIHLDGSLGSGSSLHKFSRDYSGEWSDRVMVSVGYFKDGRYRSWSHEYGRPAEKKYSLPLAVTAFTDRCLSRTKYKVRLNAGGDVEALAAVFDKSTEDIRANVWERVLPSFRSIYVRSESDPGCDFYGTTGSYGPVRRTDGKRNMLMSKAVTATEDSSWADSADNLGYDVALPEAMAAGSVSEEESAQPEVTVRVREDFRQTLAFEPFLRSDVNGDIEFSFTTSDKLSTYILSVFAHDKAMENAVLRKEFIVSQPLTLTVHEPSLLYGGDRHVFRPGISNNSGKDVSGTLTVYVYDGEAAGHPVSVQSCPVSLAAGESSGKDFAVFVPDAAAMASYSNGRATLSIKTVFNGKCSDGTEAGDALLVKIPVLDGSQVITESHSALYLAGMDREALIRSLEAEFVNTSHFGAETSETTVLSLVEELLSQKCGEPESKNVLDVSEALFAGLLSASLAEGHAEHIDTSTVPETEKLVERLLECRCADGGFGWFAGMSSSPAITATVLERLALLRDRGLLPEGTAWEEVMSDAVRYIDTQMFRARDGYRQFCGINIGEYIYLRSFFPGIPVDVKAAKAGAGAENFRKTVDGIKKYLCPKASEDRLNGRILEKARRSAAILRFTEAESKEFMKSISLKERKMTRTLGRNMASLKEYAVGHKSGGIYYPDAVMPFRALLASEAYAHSLLCDLMSDWSAYRGGDSRAEEIADGIRLWLLVQKENQKWESSFEFVNAVNSVLEGSPALMETSLITLSKTYEKPFEEIKAAGNGFSISRKFMVEEKAGASKLRELNPGETLHVGQKVTVRYSVHSDENRSLVHIRTPYNACLRPVRQLSGNTGYLTGAWRINGEGARWICPQGYREVHDDAVDWWFDVYPEENTVFEDEFYVTQEGLFTAPVCVIESLYAPDFRANAAFDGTVSVAGR